MISLYRRTPFSSFSSLDMHNHAHSTQSCTYTCHVHTHTHTHTCNVPLSAVLQAADPSHALYSLASQAFKHLPSCPQDTHTHTHTARLRTSTAHLACNVTLGSGVKSCAHACPIRAVQDPPTTVQARSSQTNATCYVETGRMSAPLPSDENMR